MYIHMHLYSLNYNYIHMYSYYAVLYTISRYKTLTFYMYICTVVHYIVILSVNNIKRKEESRVFCISLSYRETDELE